VFEVAELDGATMICHTNSVGVSTPGVPGPTSKIVAACPSPDGLARDGTQGGGTRLVLSCARGMRLQ
jgi:hypothetical protein